MFSNKNTRCFQTKTLNVFKLNKNTLCFQKKTLNVFKQKHLMFSNKNSRCFQTKTLDVFKIILTVRNKTVMLLEENMNGNKSYNPELIILILRYNIHDIELS